MTKKHRLVSALFEDFFPFIYWQAFSDCVVVRRPDELQEGDVLVVWGGGDISPSLYGKSVSMFGGGGSEPSARDRAEWALMQKAREIGVPIIGICRGAQMLTALAGGHLIQHVQGHGGMHHVITTDGEEFQTNSIHHQMMVPPEDEKKYELVAFVPEFLSEVHWDVDEKGNDVDITPEVEPEFLYFPEMKGFAIQWHPEAMSANCPASLYIKKYVLERI